jgi:hypothetical protein
MEDLRCACESRGCGRTLDEDALQIRMTTKSGERRAYECACGAVTVTVVE